MAAAILVLPLNLFGACTDSSLQPGWLWDYDGAIGGDLRVRMTLQLEGDRLRGVYFYASQLKDIQLSGRLIGGERVELDELDASGKPAARFEGVFVSKKTSNGDDDDDIGDFHAVDGCETLQGTWKKAGSTDVLPFSLSMQGGIIAELDHRYETAGAKDNEVIHRAAAQFQSAVIAGDKGKVADAMRFPLALNGAKRTTLKSRKEFLGQYDAIFTPALVNIIKQALPRNMFVRFDGIMLGSGEVWFGADGKVITLNP